MNAHKHERSGASGKFEEKGAGLTKSLSCRMGRVECDVIGIGMSCVCVAVEDQREDLGVWTLHCAAAARRIWLGWRGGRGCDAYVEFFASEKVGSEIVLCHSCIPLDHRYCITLYSLRTCPSTSAV